MAQVITFQSLSFKFWCTNANLNNVALPSTANQCNQCYVFASVVFALPSTANQCNQCYVFVSVVLVLDFWIRSPDVRDSKMRLARKKGKLFQRKTFSISNK